MSSNPGGLEALLANLSPAQGARLMTVAHQISAAARAEYGVEVPLEAVAGLVQVRDAVFHTEGGLDAVDMSNALFNLRQCEAVRMKLAADEARAAGVEPIGEEGQLTYEDLARFGPSTRIALARKLGLDGPQLPQEVRGPSSLEARPDREIAAYQASKPLEQMTPAERITHARKSGGQG
ncbi:hypothetical protein [Cribrihabitans neustonicus]|uniref:hypothetical protein n=1 Tax=Cribrihabitans neustonicus TaxID=1429085 RepID=UPI003B5AAFF5